MKTLQKSLPKQLVIRAMPLLVAIAFNPALADIAANVLPAGGQVVAGQGSMQQVGNTLNVLQNSQQMIANWQAFNIGQQATVNFIQPNAHAMVLNRVIGADPSQIFGKMNANGQVLLINPNGVLFGASAQINVGALMASTHALSNEDFLSGRLKLTGGSNAVSNAGSITAAEGGYVVLAGAKVENSGDITANGGTVALAAGKDVSVSLGQSGLLKVKVDSAAAQASIDNSGAIIADGGQVLLTAKQAAPLAAVAINQQGVIRANTVSQKNGEIWLDGGQGTVVLAGQTTATASSGHGGKIVATADKVVVSGVVDVSGANGGGSVLLGGGWQGKDPAIAEAHRVEVAKGATIAANATVDGNGGTVVLWSRDSTTHAGAISARGAGGKAGGQVETSSRGALGVSGSVDASSKGGKGGRWLLDPTDLTVVAGSGTAPAEQIYGSTIEASLNTGTQVDLQATNNITISTDISKTAGDDATLNFLAGNNILLGVGSDISSTKGKLDVNFGSSSLTSGTATLKGTVNTNGGNVTFYKEAVLAHGTPISTKITEASVAKSGDIVFNKDVQLAAPAYSVALNTQGAQSGGVFNGNGGKVEFKGSVYSVAPDVGQLTPQALSIDTTGKVSGDIIFGSNSTHYIGAPSGSGSKGALRSLTLAGDDDIAVNAGSINLLNTSGDVITASNISRLTDPSDATKDKTIIRLNASNTTINVAGGVVDGLPSGFSDYRQQTFNLVGAGALTINADRSIKIKNSAIDVKSLTLNAFANSSAGGGSVLLDTAKLQTHGNDLTIGKVGGGYATGLGADPDGVTDGVRIVNSTIKTNGGNLLIMGQAPTTASAGAGVKITGAATVISTDAGDLTIKGVVNNQAGSGNKDGVVIGEDGASRVTLETTSGDLTVTGDASGVGSVITGGTRYDGVIVSSKALLKTDSGDIRITGKGGGGSQAFLTENHGIRLEDTETSILSGSGDITLSGTSGGKTSATGGENSFGIYAKGHTMYLGSSATAGVAARGVITVEADSMEFVNSSDYHLNVASSGELRVRPLTAGQNIVIGTPGGVDKLYLGNDWFNGSSVAVFRPGFGGGNAANPGITIGRKDATARLTVAEATTFRDNTAFLMGGTGGNVLINAGLTVKASDPAQSRQLVLDVNGGAVGNGLISTNTLLLNGSGDVVLGGGNLIDTVSANLDGRLALNNAKSLTVGRGSYVRTDDPLGVKTANTQTTISTDGIVTSNDAVQLSLTNGDLTINRDINVGTATVALESLSGGIAETAAAKIVADKLYLASQNSSTLDSANQINTLAANVFGSDADLRFTNTKSLNIDRVAVVPLAADTTGTVTSGSAQNHDGITVNRMARLTLTDGDLTQSASAGQGKVMAASLKLTVGNGQVMLADSSNEIGTLAASLAATGKQITVANKNGLIIGTVDGTHGVETNNGNITLSASANAASSSGDLQLAQQVNAGTADVRLSSGKGAITETGAAGLIIANQLKLNAVKTSALDSDNAVDEVTANISGANQGMSLRNTRSLIVGALGGQTGISASGDVRLQLAKADGTVRDLTQTQDIKVGGLHVASDTGDVTLERPTNEIGKLAAKLDGVGKALKVKDKDGIEVATVYGQSGIQTNGGDVNLVASALDSTAGDLVVTDGINTGGSAGVLRLSSLQSEVKGTGKLTARKLLAQANTGVHLDNKLNNVATVAGSVSTGGGFLYKDVDTLEVGTVTNAAGGDVNGIRTNNGNVQVSVAEDASATNGDLNLTQSITAGGSGKNMALQAYKGKVTETANVSLTADQLQLLARDTTELTNPATGSGQHNIGTLAANVTGTNQHLTFFNSGALTVGSVTAEDSAGPANAVNGVSTASGGNIAIATGNGGLTLDKNVSAGGVGSVDLRAGGSSDITFNGGTAQSGSGTVQLLAGRDILTTTNNLTTNELLTTGDVVMAAGGAIGADGKRIEVADASKLAVSAGGNVWLHKAKVTVGDVKVDSVAATSYNNSSFGGSATSHDGIRAGGDISLNVANGELAINKDIVATSGGNIDLRTGGSNNNVVFGAAAGVESTGAGQVQIISSGNVQTKGNDSLANNEIRTAGNVLLSAAGGVGDNNARIKTQGVTTLAVESGAAQWLRQTSGDLVVGSVAALLPGDNSLTRTAANLAGLTTKTGNSDIHLDVASGQLAVDKNVSASGSGAVDLRSQAAMAVRSGASVSSQTGNLLFSTGGTFSAADSSAVQTLKTAGGSLVIEANGAIDLSHGKLDTSGGAAAKGGEIYVYNHGAAGNITLGQDVMSKGGSNADGGVVSLRNQNGNIVLGGVINVSRGSGTGNDGAIQLEASGNITDTASALLLGDKNGQLSAKSTSGNISLTGSANGGHQMSQVAFATTGVAADASVTYQNKTALIIGTAGGKGSALAGPTNSPASSLAAVSGVSTVAGGTNGAIKIGSGSDLTISQAISSTPVNGDGSNITLQAAGNVLGNAAITASGANGGNGGNVLLERTGNTLGGITLNARVTSNGTQGGTITVRNPNGSLALNGGLQANGTLGGGLVQLASSGDISQTAAIEANGGGSGKLKINSGGQVILTHAGNKADILAANLSGTGKALSYNNASALTVGRIDAAVGEPLTTGISSKNGAITLTTGTGNNLTVSNAVSSQGAAVVLNGGQDVLLNADVVSSGGNVTVDAKRNFLQQAGSLLAGAGKALLKAGGKAEQQGAGHIVADQLALRVADSSSLMAANNVKTVAANVSNGGLSFKNSTALTVGSVDALEGIHTKGDLSLDAAAINIAKTVVADGGALSLLGRSGDISINSVISTKGGKDLRVETTNGAIAMNGDVSAAGAVASLVAGGATGQLQMLGNLTADTVQLYAGRDIVQQAGAVNAQKAHIQALGNATLDGAANRVGTLAGNTGGNLTYRDSADLKIGSVAGVDGVTTGGRFWLRAKGNVTLDKAISASGNGNALVLVSDKRIYNNAGSTALTTPNGRWLAYDVNPLLENSLGGLGYTFRRLRTAYDAYPASQVVEQGNGYLTTAAVGFTEQFSRINGGAPGSHGESVSVALPGGVNTIPTSHKASHQTGAALKPELSGPSFDAKEIANQVPGIEFYAPMVLPVKPGRDFVAKLSDWIGDAHIESVTLADGHPLPEWMAINHGNGTLEGHMPVEVTTPTKLNVVIVDPVTSVLRLFELTVEAKSSVAAVQ